MQAAQRHHGRRSTFSKTQYQYTTLVDAWIATNLSHWAPILLQKMAGIAAVGRRGERINEERRSDAEGRNQIRDVASRVGVDPALVDSILYDAFGQRHVARIFTTLNQYYVILEVDPELPALGPNALSQNSYA